MVDGGRAEVGAESSQAVAKRVLDSLSGLHENLFQDYHSSQDAISNRLGTSRWDSLVDSDDDISISFASFDLLGGTDSQ